MRDYYRWIFLGLVLLGSLAGGASLGLLAVTRIIEKPTREFAFAVDDLRHGGLSTFEQQIRAAKSEILICAGQLSSANLLQALRAAHSNQVTIKVILDGSGSPDLRRGALGFLRANKIGELRITSTPLYDQFMIVDGVRLFVTGAPWSAAAAGAQSEASVFLLQQKGAAGMARKYFLQRFTQSRKP